MMTNAVHLLPEASGNRAELLAAGMDGITPRSQTEDRFLATQLELRQQNERLRLLLDLNEAVAANVPLPEMIRAIAGRLRATLRCDAVAVFLSDDEARRLRLCAQAHPDGKEPDSDELHPLGRGLLGTVLRSCTPWVGNPARMREQAEKESVFERLRSVCVFPLAVRDRAVGVLALGRREERAFSNDAIEFLAHPWQADRGRGRVLQGGRRDRRPAGLHCHRQALFQRRARS